jgi:hypothetical protein
MTTKKVIAINLLVPTFFIFLIPDLLPILRQIAAKDVLFALFRILPDIRSPSARSAYRISIELMVSDDKKLFDFTLIRQANAARKEFVEYITMILGFDIFTAMSHIA